MKGLNYCATMLRKGKESDEKSENKGGEKMLDETLKSVKEAEAKAAAVLQKAGGKIGIHCGGSKGESQNHES